MKGMKHNEKNIEALSDGDNAVGTHGGLQRSLFRQRR